MVETCQLGFHDLNGRVDDGCEYACLPATPSTEVCDAADNDCDGVLDEGLTAPPVIARSGVCADARQVCSGAAGWSDPPWEDIEGFEQVETLCDGLDNDCDGEVDEPFPDLGTPCDDGVGACARSGEMVCGGSGVDTRCSAVATDPAVTDGMCDGVDDDCDGIVDEDPPCNGCPSWVEIEPGYVCIPPGSFTMGSPDDEEGRDPDEGPRREVELSRPLLMARTEVTRSLWQSVPAIDWDASQFHCDNMCVGESEADCPMNRMSWGEAAMFANALTDKANVDREGPALTRCYRLGDCVAQPADLGFHCDRRRAMADPGDFCRQREIVRDCTGYRLPTEAEWEYAARAGSVEARPAMDTQLTDLAWFADNADGRIHAAGLLEPNTWGLFDMLGNVSEWTDDFHRADGYAFANGAPQGDPVGAPGSDHEPPNRAVRGASYRDTNEYLRSALRGGAEQQDGLSHIGMRLVRRPSMP